MSKACSSDRELLVASGEGLQMINLVKLRVKYKSPAHLSQLTFSGGQPGMLQSCRSMYCYHDLHF